MHKTAKAPDTGIGEQSPFKLSDVISIMISDACTPQIESDITIKL